MCIGMKNIWMDKYYEIVWKSQRTIAVNTTVKRSSANPKNVCFWAGQIPAGQTSPKGTISGEHFTVVYTLWYISKQFLILTLRNEDLYGSCNGVGGFASIIARIFWNCIRDSQHRSDDARFFRSFHWYGGHWWQIVIYHALLVIPKYISAKSREIN